MSTKYVVLISGIILAVLVFAAVMFEKQGFINLLNKYNLLPKPESLTELYFEDHDTLPKSLIATEEADFKFTVHNLEYKEFPYEYKIEAISTESAKLIEEGSFTLNHDEYKTISERISTEEASIRTKINISLTNKNQSIHFWVNE